MLLAAPAILLVQLLACIFLDYTVQLSTHNARSLTVPYEHMHINLSI